MLVSVIDATEVDDAIAGGADIVDVKNPKEGSLGAPPPRTIRQVLSKVASRRETSCAIGDMPNLPGTASLAAAGAAGLGPDYVKVGLRGTTDQEESIVLMKEVVDAVGAVSPRTRVVACAYADYRLLGSVSPLCVPRVASIAGAHGVLVDTVHKDGRCLFDFLTLQELALFTAYARQLGLFSALAGSLRTHHAPLLASCGTDVVGIRGAACADSDRVKGRLLAARIREFKAAIPTSPRSTQD